MEIYINPDSKITIDDEFFNKVVIKPTFLQEFNDIFCLLLTWRMTQSGGPSFGIGTLIGPT